MRWSRWCLVFVLLLAFGLWVHDLDGMGLWRDEGLSVMRARQPVRQLLRNVNVISGIESADLHPPGYFLLLAGWRRLLGESEFAYRLLSVLAMLVGMAVVARTAGRWSRVAGVCAAGMMLVSPFVYWYAREARMYACVVLLAAVLLLLDGRGKRWLWWGVAVGLCGVHYAGVFLVGALFLVGAAGLPQRRGGRGGARGFGLGWVYRSGAGGAEGRGGFWMFLGLGLVVLFVVGVFWESVGAVLMGEFEHFAVRPFSDLFWEPLSTFMLGSYGRPVGVAWGWFVPFLAVAAVGVAVRWRWGAWLVVTVVLAWLSSLVVPNYTNPRHLMVLLPIWVLLLGAGLGRLWGWHWVLGVVGTAGVLTAAVPALVGITSAPPVVKDDVRGAVQAIKQKMRPGDGIIVHDVLLEPLVAYYAPDLPWRTLPWWDQHDVAEVRGETWLYAEQFEHVWLLGVAGFESGVDGWLDYHWSRGDEAYFAGTGQTLLLREYGRWGYVERPGRPLLVDGGSAVYEVTWGDLVEGKGAWFDVLVNGGEARLPTLCVELVAPDGRVAANGCQTGLGPMDVHSDRIWVDLPLGLADVVYQVRVRLGDVTADIDTVQVVQSDGGGRPLGSVNDVEIVGIRWAAEQFTAGQWAIGDILVRGSGGDEMMVRLLDWRGRVVGEDVITLGEMTAGDVVARPFRVRLPFAGDGVRWLHVGDIKVDKTRIMPIPRMTVLPDEAIPLSEKVVWHEAMQLVAYAFEQENDAAVLRLYWQLQAEQPAYSDYHVFVHVGVPGQPPLAQTSGVPGGNARPIVSWRPGEVIEDVHTIALNGAAGVVQVGWFDAADPAVRPGLLVDGAGDNDQIFELGALSPP